MFIYKTWNVKNVYKKILTSAVKVLVHDTYCMLINWTVLYSVLIFIHTSPWRRAWATWDFPWHTSVNLTPARLANERLTRSGTRERREQSRWQHDPDWRWQALLLPRLQSKVKNLWKPKKCCCLLNKRGTKQQRGVIVWPPWGESLQQFVFHLLMAVREKAEGGGERERAREKNTRRRRRASRGLHQIPVIIHNTL